MVDTYDVIVIGAGPAGENAAAYVQDHGLRAVVVEHELVGGECSYWACMPSKALLRPTESLAAARRIPAAASAVTGEVDVDRVLGMRDAFAAHYEDDGQVGWLDSEGIALVRGHGRLSGLRQVTVELDDGGSTVLEAERAVIVAVGTAAAVPGIDGLRDIDPWDNRDATAAKEVPQRLLVLGGGVVGVEMAQAWKRLGADEVTVVEMEESLLAAHEPFVGRQLADAFAAEGIELRLGAKLVAAERDGDDGPVTTHLADGSTLVGDELLVATGRTPRTGDLGLESVGLEPGGYLDVDDQLRVRGVDGGWLYAVGDVNGRSLLTHMGKYQARLVGDALGGHGDGTAWAGSLGAPGVVFTDPQVASVGLTEQAARDHGIDVRTVSYGLGDVAGGALMGKGHDGRAQLVIDRERRVVVGATFVGPAVSEMLHAATIAVVAEVPLDVLWHAVPAFPTVSEVWLRLLEATRSDA